MEVASQLKQTKKEKEETLRRIEREKERFLSQEKPVWDQMHRENERHVDFDSLSEDEAAMVLPPPAEEDLYSLVWRSAVLPGWGQMYAGEKTRGALYAPIMLGGWAYSYASIKRWQSARDQYNSLNLTSLLFAATQKSPFAPLYFYNRATSQQRIANGQNTNIVSATALVGMVYLINLVDAAFFSRKSDPSQMSLPPTEWNWSLEGDTASLQTTELSGSLRKNPAMGVGLQYTFHF